MSPCVLGDPQAALTPCSEDEQIAQLGILDFVLGIIGASPKTSFSKSSIERLLHAVMQDPALFSSRAIAVYESNSAILDCEEAAASTHAGVN